MTPLSEQQNTFFNTVVSMVDGLPKRDNPFKKTQEIKTAEKVPSLQVLAARAFAFKGGVVDRVVDQSNQVKVFTQADSLNRWIMVAENMIPAGWEEGLRESAKSQLKINNIEVEESEAVDRFLGFLFDQIIYEQGTVTTNDRIHKALESERKISSRATKVVPDSPSQKVLQAALKTFSNSYVQFGIKLAVAWTAYRLTKRLMNRSFTYIRGNLVPIAVIKITNHVPAQVIGTVSKVYDYKWRIFFVAWGLSWIPQFRPVMNPLQKGAWQVIRLPSTITDLPGNLAWALGKKAFSSTEGGMAETHKKLHRWVNYNQAQAIGEAKQLWIDIAKQKIGYQSASTN